MIHPQPWQVARTLRDLAAVLDRYPRHDERAARVGKCRCLTCRAEAIAARGYPASTGGDGSGIRSTSPSSSTEHAALTDDRLTDLDTRLAGDLRRVWHTALTVATTVHDVTAHDSDDDPIPPGTGECDCCGTFCAPRKRGPEDRLRAGLAPACYRAWLRWRQRNPHGSRSDFIAERRRRKAG